MPSTVKQVFRDAGLKPQGCVRWGAPVPRRQPGEPETGVYVVALTDDDRSTESALGKCPLDNTALDQLIRVRPELLVESRTPTRAALRRVLGGFWMPDEVVLYIGQAGQPLPTRVRQYYRTPLGADKQHAGGWPLKTLRVLRSVWVHYARTDDYDNAERAMLRGFARRVSQATRAGLYRPDPVMPFANLRDADYRLKLQGAIRNATGPMPT